MSPQFGFLHITVVWPLKFQSNVLSEKHMKIYLTEINSIVLCLNTRMYF